MDWEPPYRKVLEYKAKGVEEELKRRENKKGDAKIKSSSPIWWSILESNHLIINIL